MSNIGFVVPAKTADAIRVAARDSRVKLGLDQSGRIAFTDEWIEDLLFRNLSAAYDIEVDLRKEDDAEMSGAYAAYRPRYGVLLLKESLLRQASVGDKEAHFTIFHEIGHVHMHSEHWLFRKVETGRLPMKSSDPEWQADRFAIEFAIDRNELIDRYGSEVAAASNYYKLPFYRLQGFVSETNLMSSSRQKKNDIERYLNAVQSDFDF